MNPLLLTRLDKGWTLEELAEKSGVNRDTISRIENGRKAQPLTLKKLAVALGIPVTEFAGLMSEGRGPKEDRQTETEALAVG